MKEREIHCYLNQYPKLRKWLTQCACSGAAGYRPDMPEHIGGEGSVAGEHLRRMLRPPAADEAGLCDVCRKLMKNK